MRESEVQIRNPGDVKKISDLLKELGQKGVHDPSHAERKRDS
jgi:hypothetical protein